MRRLLIAVLAAAAATCVGCVDDNPGLVVAGNIKADDMCLVAPTGGTLVAYGVYDVAIPHPYLVAPLFRSGLVSRTATAGAPRAEPNDILIEGAVVDITGVGGAALPGVTSSYSVAMTAFVPAAVEGAVGTATGLVQAIPASVGAELATLPADTTTVVVQMTFFGHTTGGTAIDANPWSWTLDVCRGCLEVPCGTVLSEAQCFAGQDGYVYKLTDCVAGP